MKAQQDWSHSLHSIAGMLFCNGRDRSTSSYALSEHLYFFPPFRMRTLLSTRIAAALLSMMFAVPAFAQGASTSAGAATSVDLACMSAAIETRENAVLSARTTFNASIVAAIQTRRDALKAAFTIANNADRMVAIKAALNAYATAAANARATFKASVKAAWSAFATARVNCHIDADSDVSVRHRGERDDRDDDDRHDRGLHLGWLRHSMKTKAWINGNIKLDLE